MADQVRRQREEHQLFNKQQRERFRNRGVMLKAERQASQTAINNTVEGCRQQAAHIGDKLRRRQAELRQRRHSQDLTYELHGRELTKKYSTNGNQQLVRELKAEIEREREEKATVMRNLLKKLKKETDDGIFEVNCERVRRVYAETAHPVVRVSKQNTYVSRRDKAQEVRQLVAKLKRIKEDNDAERVDRAHDIVDEVLQARPRTGYGTGGGGSHAVERPHEMRFVRRAREERRQHQQLEQQQLKQRREQQQREQEEQAEAELTSADDEPTATISSLEQFGGDLLSRMFGWQRKLQPETRARLWQETDTQSPTQAGAGGGECASACSATSEVRL